MPRIAIEGNICSGKTHYLKMLESDGYLTHHIEQSELTNKYTCDYQRYSLAYYLNQLYTYTTFPYNKQELHFYESSPYSLKNVHGDLLYEKKIFDVSEYKLYTEYNNKMGWTPDIIIYLHCHPEVCFKRCQNKFDISYFKDIHLKYEILCDEINCPITIYKINSQENSDDVYKNIIDIIKKL